MQLLMDPAYLLTEIYERKGKRGISDKLLTKLEENEPELASSQEDEEYQDPIQQITEEEEIRERRLPPIKEFQRDYRAGKASTRIRCAQKIVTQLETSPSPRATSGVTTSTSSASSCGRAASKRPASTPKMSVVQEVQKSKKEKEREKEREKAEKARQKEEEKAEKTRQKEAKKLAKEEKKRAKKEAKARRKEAEEALLRDDK
ncbi:serine arginine repetitive matrix protein 2-like isoform x1 protein [Lasius niger]|uniref:Serine arginine repetitive matrix protein 2-like isoform x1 protein n=1 Tax=Lasius niger TaxID=67767 RepID=A0A0J7NQH2_LASNI|nr:serine arginine repetitive matrix protein 2-like isoform x1 protein [Lasius niger]